MCDVAPWSGEVNSFLVFVILIVFFATLSWVMDHLCAPRMKTRNVPSNLSLHPAHSVSQEYIAERGASWVAVVNIWECEIYCE